MANVIINKELCIGCGLCVKGCSRQAIQFANEKAEVDLSSCSECGHCVAICPQNAVSTPDYDGDEIFEYDKEIFKLDPEHLLNFIKFRRSIRQFKTKKIETEKLNAIIEAGRYSPTGGNRQSNRYIIIKDKINEVRDLTIKTLYKFASDSNFDMGGWSGYRNMWIKLYKDYMDKNIDRLFFNACAVVVIVSDDPTGNAELNGGIAASRMELQANSLGLGVCYIGFFKRAAEFNPKLKEMIGIKDNEKFVLSFVLGYPDVKYLRTVNRKPADVSFY
jgi:nitroreductase/NAD-dependent dihydropyrimidine dehydrogenase PreA subunit